MKPILKVVIPVAVLVFLYFFVSNDYRVETQMLPIMLVATATISLVTYIAVRVFSRKN
jgi:undecaprenyl pyrophosphate phosphatase UppP